jgi:PDZ-binding kinase
MEECTQSLGDLIENYSEMQLGPFTPELIYVVIAGISKALAYLHNECKLLHGDMKSHNILIKGEFVDISKML